MSKKEVKKQEATSELEVLEIVGSDTIKTLEEYKKEIGPQCELFAVYGTLRKGGSNNSLFYSRRFTTSGTESSQSIHLGRFVTEPKFKMYSLGGFPGVVNEEENPIGIVCDVYLVSQENIKRSLDMLEGYRGEEFNDPNHGYSNFYNKEKVQTPWGEAWIYIYNSSPREDLRVVTNGDWLNRNS